MRERQKEMVTVALGKGGQVMVYLFISFQRIHSPKKKKEIAISVPKRQAEMEKHKRRQKMSDYGKIIDAAITAFHQKLCSPTGKSMKERLREQTQWGFFKRKVKAEKKKIKKIRCNLVLCCRTPNKKQIKTQ